MRIIPWLALGTSVLVLVGCGGAGSRSHLLSTAAVLKSLRQHGIAAHRVPLHPKLHGPWTILFPRSDQPVGLVGFVATEPIADASLSAVIFDTAAHAKTHGGTLAGVPIYYHGPPGDPKNGKLAGRTFRVENVILTANGSSVPDATAAVHALIAETRTTTPSG